MRRIDGNWIDYYLKSCEAQESPWIYHRFVAVSLIASVLDDCVTDMGHFVIRPNSYIILVGPAGKTKKGSAIKLGVNRILKEIDNPPRMFAQKITPERLIQFLGEGADAEEGFIKEKATAFAVSEELSIFMGSAHSRSQIIELLTDLFDFHDYWRYEAKMSTDERDELHNAGALNLLAASTPDWLRQSIPYSALGGGFMCRTLFVYSDQPRGPFALPYKYMPDNMDEIIDNLIHDLSQISQLSGSFELTPKAEEWYEQWYNNVYELTYGGGVDDFFSRWHVYAIKLAMILSAAQSDEMVITKEHIKEGIEYLEMVKGRMGTVIDNMITVESEMPTSKILQVIKRRSPISHKELAKYARNFCRADQLSSVITTLKESGEIDSSLDPKTNQKTYYYLGK